MRKTASIALLEQLAAEHRHIVSRWRALIMLRRATFATPLHERRWRDLPLSIEDLAPLLRQMRQRGEITPLRNLVALDEVTVPYARQGVVDEREVLFELHPYAVLSHLSALEFHGLTNDQPRTMTVTVSADGSGGLLPIGTGPRDWEGVARPGGTRVSTILGTPLEWLTTKPERFFGFAEYEPLGFAVRYTTPERTLIDGLQNPELAGGIANVLNAWLLARDIIDLDVLVYQVERYHVKILRQRVGYVLDQLGLDHPRLDEWQRSTQRGGSSRLVAAEPFASTYDERWSLSLNAPVTILAGDSA